MKIIVMNGPNLNLLGQREPDKYGHTTLARLEQLCHETARALGHEVECLQSNHEGVLIDALHSAGAGFQQGEVAGVVLNAGAFTHSSIALHDAIRAVAPLPVIEVHISNVHAREAFRHHSWISAVAAGIVIGLGVDGYRVAIEALARRLPG
jgi:3-dehydroquinate dehydratase-2